MSSPLRSPVPSSAGADQLRAGSDVRLSVEQVSYAYSPNPSQAPLFTLEALSFQAKPAEIVAILGPNACGKSTLLKLISGELQPMSGRIFLNGFETHTLPAKRARSESPWCSRKAGCCSRRGRGNLCCRDGTRMAEGCVLKIQRTC